MEEVSSQSPNIIIICADQHRADTIGSYGSTVCCTPALDRLAAQGVQFNRCYANNPVCAPSRATILTGLQSTNHGLLRNGYELSRQLPTLASTMQQHGYHTHAIGKLHLSPQEHGVDQAPYYGFNTLEPSEDPKIGPYLEWAIANFPEYANYLIGTLFNLPTNNGYWQGRHDYRDTYLSYRQKYVIPHEISDTCNWGHGHLSPLPAAAHQTTWITERAIAAINGRPADKPLLLWVGYQDPHDPYDPPAPWRDLYSPDTIPPTSRQQGRSTTATPGHAWAP
mgnify:CR=1 FL=1